jgi:hypothetical protein
MRLSVSVRSAAQVIDGQIASGIRHRRQTSRRWIAR